MSRKENTTDNCIVKRYAAKTSSETLELFVKRLTQIAEKQELNALDKTFACVVALRSKLAKSLKYTELVELINAKCSTLTSTNSAKSLKEKKFDFRNAIYSCTVSLYDKKSKFANSFTIFDIACKVNVKVHSSTETQAHTLLELNFDASVLKALNDKKLASVVKAVSAKVLVS